MGPCDPVLVYSLVPKANWRSQGWCDWSVATTTGSLWPTRTSSSVTGTEGGDGLWERAALRRELMIPPISQAEGSLWLAASIFQPSPGLADRAPGSHGSSAQRCSG